MYVFEGGRKQMVTTLNNFVRHIKHLDVRIASPGIDMIQFAQYADF